MRKLCIPFCQKILHHPSCDDGNAKRIEKSAFHMLFFVLTENDPFSIFKEDPMKFFRVFTSILKSRTSTLWIFQVRWYVGNKKLKSYLYKNFYRPNTEKRLLVIAVVSANIEQCTNLFISQFIFKLVVIKKNSHEKRNIDSVICEYQ